ncbi:MAG: hypothetical protein IKZ35_01330 [Clostridia bacterium]|nr:hypothetical protein [Clostridia bacterium]
MDKIITYELFKEDKWDEDNGSYTAYGIRTSNKEEEVGDITVNLCEALKILRVLNDNNVSIYHFKDVIYDLLNL